VTSYSLDARRIGTVHDANENSRRQPSTSPPVPRSCSRPPGTSRSSSEIVRGYRPPDPRGEEDLLDLCCKIVTPPFGGVAQRGCLAYRLDRPEPFHWPIQGAQVEAIRYALSRWDGLIRFLDDGRIELRQPRPSRLLRLELECSIVISDGIVQVLELEIGEAAATNGACGGSWIVRRPL
jgi:hypothetical protein